MKYLITLWLVLIVSTEAAVINGGVFYATDTTGTNARPSAVTITPSTGGTNLLAGTLASSNVITSRKAYSGGVNTPTVWGATPSEEAMVITRVPGLNGDTGTPELWISRNSSANLTSDYTFMDLFPDATSSTLTIGRRVSGNIVSVLMNATATRPSIQYGITGTGSSIDTSGSGTPEGVVTAAVGSTYRRWDGGANTTFYAKTSGAGNTGWTALSAGSSGTSGTVINTGIPAVGNVPSYSDITGTNVVPFTALTLTSTNASLTGALGVGAAAVVGTTITLKGNTTNSSAYLAHGYNSAGSEIFRLDNNGRIDAVSYDTEGPPYVLTYRPATPSNGIRIGHYAFATLDNALNQHTIADLEARISDVSSNSLDSSLRFYYMNNVDGSSGYQQPNVYMSLSSAGLNVPESNVSIGTNTLVAQSGALRLKNLDTITMRNAANNGDIVVAQVAGGDDMYIGANSSLVAFQTASTLRAYITSAGLNGGTANSFDIGTSTLPMRTVRAATSVLANNIVVTNTLTIGGVAPMLQSWTISPGNGMSGGGDGSANRTLTWAPSLWTSSTLTLGDGSQSTLSYTINLSGTDPIWSYSSGVANLSSGALQVGGVAVSTATGANPSASVGLAAVNGSASTWMRSDGAPALSQAIVPTWTGAHTFNAGSGVPVTIQPGAADTSELIIKGGSVTGSGTTPFESHSGTWNTSGNTTGFVWNITNTASGASSIAADFQVNGTSIFKVTKSGQIQAASTGTSPQLSFIGNTGSGLEDDTFNNVYIKASTVRQVRISSTGDLYTTTLGLGSVSAPTSLFSSEGSGVTQLGTDAATATDQAIKAHDGSGTDKNGAALTIAGGQSTGTGAPGKVLFKRGTVSTTGSSANAYGTSVSAGGTLDVNTTTTGNIGAGEDNLITYSIPAAQMSVNKDRIEFDCAGTFAATVNAKTLKVYFGATAIFNSSSLVLNGIGWRVHGTIVRTGAATQKATVEATIGGTLLSAVNSTITQYTTPAETLSGAVTFKCTGSDDGGVPADNAVVEELSVVKFHFAP